MHKSLTRRYAGTLLSATLLALTAGCTKDSATVSAADVEKDTPVAVSFDTYLQNSRQSTRSTYPLAPVGMIDDAQLKTSGFGVFAQYAGSTAWTSYTDKATTPFNFMWNQQVGWNAGSTAWTYSPVKYWPNDNNPADKNGATGSQEHSYLNFFAYAPYVEANSLPPTGRADATADGIIEMTTNNTAIDGSYLYYRTSIEKPFGEDKSVDLLWATKQDCYKYDGTSDANDDGRVNDRVDLVFKHALSLFTVTVQGLFDHKDNSDASTTYPADRDPYTKILIESVDFSGSPLFSAGKMYLAPQSADATVPHWELDDSDGDSDGTPDLKYNLKVEHENINLTFANRYLDGTWMKYWDENDMSQGLLKESDVDDNGTYDADDADSLFNKLPMGVSHTEVPLYYETDHYYMVLPNKEYRDANSSVKMKVRIVYYVITYDERLTLVKTGYPKFFSIVKNDITATFDTFSFEPNKKYKLRLQPGLTSAKFEVTAVDGWDTPLTIDPEVVDWYETPIEYNVE